MTTDKPMKQCPQCGEAIPKSWRAHYKPDGCGWDSTKNDGPQEANIKTANEVQEEMAGVPSLDELMRDCIKVVLTEAKNYPDYKEIGWNTCINTLFMAKSR